MQFQQQSTESLEWPCKCNWCAPRIHSLASPHCNSSFMGTNAFVKINEEWWEPSIIWFVIAARKGEKKTAALKRICNLRKPIEATQNRLSGKKTPMSKNHLHQLIADHFSFEELHSIMCRNRSQVLGCFYERRSSMDS